MIPGSVTVEVGDQVFTGDVLGLLGNSGNSTGPHLHFHLCDEPSALGCEGVPYIFDSFFVSGLFNPEYDFTDFYVFGMTDERNDEIPASCVVVNFPE